MWCPGSGVVLDCIDFLSLHSFLLLKLPVCRTCLSTILFKKGVNSTGPNSLVVKASASGGEGRRLEPQCLRQWGLF